MPMNTRPFPNRQDSRAHNKRLFREISVLSGEFSKVQFLSAYMCMYVMHST